MDLSHLVASARLYGRVEVEEGRLTIDGKFPKPLLSQLIEQRDDLRSYLASQSADVPEADLRESLNLLRISLPENLAGLPDEKLALLVRHAVFSARERTQGMARRYCRSCGLPLSSLAVSDRCGYCNQRP